ncbi:hypothetical protein D4S03_12300 [bacterium]|nr:MAG: hypothetical protein D4S03_12300 [bacterium]
MPAATIELRNVTAFGFLALCVFLVGCVVTPPECDSPVTPQRLTSARLTDIREDLSWSFTDTVVVIQNKDQPIPSDLIETLLGDKTTRTRIEASWQLDEKAGLLRLSSMKVDGEKIDRESVLPIKPAGHVRVNLGTRQYNLFPGGAKGP